MSFSRRAFARVTIAGAAGLALLPKGLLADGDLAAEWAELGRIWREMSMHRRGDTRHTSKTGEAIFKGIKEKMLEALDAVDPSPELRALFEERWYHVWRSRYFMATCYKMSIEGSAAMRARGDVEKQVQELEALAEEGNISEKTLKRAAKAMAPAAEYLSTAREVWAEEEPAPQARENLHRLARRYMDGELKPGEDAQRAGARGAELTVDQAGDIT